MQTIKRNWVYLFFGLSALIFVAGRLRGSDKHGSRTGDLQLTMRTVKTETGWGYDLLLNDTVYIHQDRIPALPGQHSFLCESDARSIGRLALARLKHTRFPVITIAELDSCHILR